MVERDSSSQRAGRHAIRGRRRGPPPPHASFQQGRASGDANVQTPRRSRARRSRALEEGLSAAPR